MRKRLDTRFPASRIKKIMQTDEDVGKIALAVPVLVSKALELFLQDLCDRSYNVTLQRGVKTLSSQHLKQCVHKFNHYDFLREIVSKVPDLGNNEGGSSEGRSTQRRRTAEEEDHEEPLKKSKIDAEPAYNASSSTGTSSGTGRGRGRPRGSGRGRRGGARGAERDAPNCEDDLVIPPLNTDELGPSAGLSNSAKENAGPVRNFDLNVDFSENVPAPIGSSTPTEPQPLEMSQDTQSEYPGWSMDDLKKMAGDPVQFALTHRKVDEEEEDYDDEEY